MRYTILVLILVFISSGCATTAVTKTSPDYKINIADELRIVIWKELDEKVIVRPDGRISLPLIGEVYCKDKTPKSLSEELTKTYQQQTIVIVTKAHSIKNDLKDLIGFLRDVSFVYFLTERIAED